MQNCSNTYKMSTQKPKKLKIPSTRHGKTHTGQNRPYCIKHHCEASLVRDTQRFQSCRKNTSHRNGRVENTDTSPFSRENHCVSRTSEASMWCFICIPTSARSHGRSANTIILTMETQTRFHSIVKQTKWRQYYANIGHCEILMPFSWSHVGYWCYNCNANTLHGPHFCVFGFLATSETPEGHMY